MPNCFQLIRRDTGTAAVLQTVDRELCQNLGLPYDDRAWTCNWYNIIGFSVAMGSTLPQLVDRHREQRDQEPELWADYHSLHRIAAYLNEHYSTDAWYEVKR